MRTITETQAEREVVQFLTSQPPPEAIIAFHPSPGVTERLYDLVEIERERSLGDDEQRELDSYLCLNHLLKMMKIEAHRQLGQQASQSRWRRRFAFLSSCATRCVSVRMAAANIVWSMIRANLQKVGQAGGA
jgi:hypothetical protein